MNSSHLVLGLSLLAWAGGVGLLGVLMLGGRRGARQEADEGFGPSGQP